MSDGESAGSDWDEVVDVRHRPGTSERAKGWRSSPEASADLDSVGEDDEDEVYALCDEMAAARAEERATLSNFTAETAAEVVERINASLRVRGYVNMVSNRAKEFAVYYKCACRAAGCFNVTVHRALLMGSKTRRAARWSIKEMPAQPQHCHPREPMAVAQSSSFIPRLCHALGFAAPKEATGASNTNVQSVRHVLHVYAEQLRALNKVMEASAARVAAMDYMRKYEMTSESGALGEAPVVEGCWLYCGLLDNEELSDVPVEEKRLYCGRVFHFECCGMLKKPTRKTEHVRVPCLDCLADERYRAKAAAGDKLIDQVMYHAHGQPCILPRDNDDARVPVLGLLVCNCGDATGTGLPCAGMLAVARQLQGVLSYRHVHPHWFSHTITDYEEPSAVIEGNQARELDVNAVIISQVPHARPSTLDSGLPVPSGVTARAGRSRGSEAVARIVTQSAPGGLPLRNLKDNVRAGDDVDVLELQLKLPPARPRPKSRRYKSAKKSKGGSAQ